VFRVSTVPQSKDDVKVQHQHNGFKYGKNFEKRIINGIGRKEHGGEFSASYLQCMRVLFGHVPVLADYFARAHPLAMRFRFA
jgi:hypothetical protein